MHDNLDNEMKICYRETTFKYQGEVSMEIKMPIKFHGNYVVRSVPATQKTEKDVRS